MNTTINDALHDAVVEIAQIRVLHKAAEQDGTILTWQPVLDEPRCWSVRHGLDHSVVPMSQTEIEQSMVEDLLVTHACASRGAAVSYPEDQPYRHLGRVAFRPSLRQSIAQAVEAVVASGMALRIEGGGLGLNPEMLAKAQDFCGVYVTLGPVEDDIFEDWMAQGGTELGADVFEDVAVELEKPYPGQRLTPGAG